MGSRRKVVLFNVRNGEAGVDDLVSVTRKVFANEASKATRKLQDYPDDEDAQNVGDDDLMGDYEEEEEVPVPQKSKKPRTLDSIFKKLQAINSKPPKKAKKIPVASVRNRRRILPARFPASARALRSRSNLSWRDDESEMDDDEEEAIVEDCEVEDYEDGDPQVLGEETHVEDGQVVRVIYVNGHGQVGGFRRKMRRMGGNHSVVRGPPMRFAPPRRIRNNRISTGIASRVSFVSNDAHFSDYADDKLKGTNTRYNGRIRKPYAERAASNSSFLRAFSPWEGEPARPWARKQPRITAENGDRFEPWLKCHCGGGSVRHKHKGRGFVAGRMHAFE